MKVYWCNGSLNFTPESDEDEAALDVWVDKVLPVFFKNAEICNHWDVDWEKIDAWTISAVEKEEASKQEKEENGTP